MFLLLYFKCCLLLMDILHGQPVMQEIPQKHITQDSNDAVIKEVLKLVALSGLLQENSHEIWSYYNVIVIFF